MRARSPIVLTLAAVVLSPGIAGSGAGSGPDLERLFRARPGGPDGVTVEAVIYAGADGAGPVSIRSIVPWCADLCLKGAGGTTPTDDDYRRALGEATARFRTEAVRILSASGGPADPQVSGLLDIALRRVYGEAGVYRALSRHIERNRGRADSCLEGCIEGTLRAAPGGGPREAWKGVVSIGPDDGPGEGGRILIGGDAAGLDPAYQAAARRLSDDSRFRACLTTVIARHPVLEDAVGGLGADGSKESLANLREGVWLVWERSGVKAIVEQAARERPDEAVLASLLDACLQGP